MPEYPDFFRGLVDSSPDGVLVTRRDRIEFANRAALQLCAMDTADWLLGTAVLDLFTPQTHGAVRDALEQVRQGATAVRAEARLAFTGRTEVVVEIAMTALGHDGMQLTLRDVTARCRTEAQLRESEERLALAVAGAREGVWDLNLETGHAIYSPRWAQMLGYEAGEIESHISAFHRLVHPDDRVRADAAQNSVASGQSTFEAEFRLRHKDGHYVHVLSRGYPVRRRPGGPVVRIVGTHLDLTDRKLAEAALRESEERLRLAFDGAQEGVWDWNLETGAVLYSPRWTEMLGYGPDEIEPHVRAWEQLIHPDDVQLAQYLKESLEHGAQIYEGEFRLRHKNGQYLHVLSRGFPVRRVPGGPVVRIVGTHFDLTARKAAEARAEQRRAEQARTEWLTRLIFAQEDERRRIAREMHDQFGEQLTALARRIERIRNVAAGRADLVAPIDALEDIARQLDRDVEQLVWELRPTALDDLGLRAALDNYVQTWSQREGIAAELHTSGLLDDRLASDTETTLYRIAQEALTNVARHSRASRVDVILERRGNHVLLIVEDNGIGFDPSRRAAPGSSFGLVGMQERAALVGAILQVVSAPGEGTTVLLRREAPSPAPAGQS